MSLERIDRFRGPWHFLSNFFIESHGKSNEHYFQAAKTIDKEARQIILNADGPREAKRLGSPEGFQELSERLGRTIVLREDWDDICQEVMLWGLRRKFSHPGLRAKLLETGDAYLEEGLTWHDRRWGVCYCSKHKGTGENWLGKLLMQLREELLSGVPAA